jgi:excisionase family DNA binding protein
MRLYDCGQRCRRIVLSYDATDTARRSGAMSAKAQGGPLGEVRFLTVAEVATAMRVSKMTVYRLVHAGTLPAVQVGRSFRIPEQAVSDYLRDSYVQAG